MKKFILVAITFLGLFSVADANAKVKTKKIVINTEADAKIIIDGKQVAANTTQIKVLPYSTVNVRIEKVGFINEERNYVNDGKHVLPESDFIKLEKDDAYENSYVTDIANRDVDIHTTHTEDDAWKLISRIITNNFDVIQVTDKSTGYMCTAWVVKTFKAATVRTRLIIKTAGTDPLTYKAKLVSEIGPSGTSASQDENFKSWDRLLRTFENVVTDLQSRLSK